MATHTLNTQTLGITEYTGWTLVKVFEHAGRYYALGSTQLFEITGADDDGTNIDAHVLLGKQDFDSYEEKRVSRAYVRDEYGNALTLTTLVDTVNAEEVAAETSIDYSIPARTGARQHMYTVRPRLDVKGTSWAFKVANVSGGGLSLKGLMVEVEGIEIDK